MINVNKTSLKQILNFCEDYAEKRGIRIVYESDVPNDITCWANVEDKTIFLNTRTFRKNVMAFAFFHEIGHFEVYKLNLFKVARDVYSPLSFNKLSDKDKIIYRMTALRLEQWCDIFGEKEVKKYFINAISHKPYFTNRGKNYIRENYYF